MKGFPLLLLLPVLVLLLKFERKLNMLPLLPPPWKMFCDGDTVKRVSFSEDIDNGGFGVIEEPEVGTGLKNCLSF